MGPHEQDPPPPMGLGTRKREHLQPKPAPPAFCGSVMSCSVKHSTGEHIRLDTCKLDVASQSHSHLEELLY
ncbi:hypothetical protein QC762_0028920 [Podospora pseudocomata]|uniref:Uncharacterized protein n=1 Tax=Podospora pseudocomata TaxID=2093779 RepID=A0ABR0GRY7_9PEZI|nr:hypothetical protein QC762_0028920 [Podospora pseudocomata]